MLSFAVWSVRERGLVSSILKAVTSRTHASRGSGAVLSVTTRRRSRATTWLLSGEACVLFKLNETFKLIF